MLLSPTLCGVTLPAPPAVWGLRSPSGAPPNAEPRSLLRPSWALTSSFCLLIFAISARTASAEKSETCDAEEAAAGRPETGRPEGLEEELRVWTSLREREASTDKCSWHGGAG